MSVDKQTEQLLQRLEDLATDLDERSGDCETRQPTLAEIANYISQHINNYRFYKEAE